MWIGVMQAAFLGKEIRRAVAVGLQQLPKGFCIGAINLHPKATQ